MPTAAKPKGLVAKLAEIMGLIEKPIPKEGFNKAQQYAFVSESDVSAAIRPLLAERGIWLWSSVIASSIEPLFTTSSGSQMWLTTVTMEFQFIDSETGEVTEKQTMVGQGADQSDKGAAKAVSMTLKYFLLKAFMLSTGRDDNEADDKVDKAVAAAGAAPGPTRIKKSELKGVQRGGKSDVATDAQVDEVARLTVAKGLDAKGLIPIIEQTIKKTPPAGANPREWLGALSGKDIAAIIAALNEYEPVPDAFTDGTGPLPGEEDGGETVEQDTLAIV